MTSDTSEIQSTKEGITITARCGRIRGIESTSEYSGKIYFSFLGIPYAIPPVGHLRFEPPVPHPRLIGIFDADTNRDCIQYSLFDHQIIGSEDCLYLNVHIPEVPNKNDPSLPVVVKLHFGGYLWGSGSTKSTGSADYVMHCGIVYVTITFRLHVLGFLSLNTPQSAGNMGLKDIVLALRWVQQNIKYFGGNPNNVTLLGSSSGSIKIHQLMMIRSCKGLFHKAILMGMYALHPFVHYPPDPVEQAFKLGQAMNFTGQSLSELYIFLKYAPLAACINPLRGVDVRLLEERKKFAISSPFLPVYDSVDGFLPKMPENLTNIENPVPIIYGICDYESPSLFVPKYRSFFDDHFYLLLRQSCYLWTYPLNESEMKQIEDEVHQKYGDNDVTIADRAVTDFAIAEFYNTFAEILQDMRPEIPLYIYKFQYVSKLNDFSNLIRTRCVSNLKGSFHADDIFYWMSRGKPLTRTDKFLVNLITKLFCNFAKNGDPNEPNEKVFWSPSTKENPCYISITGKHDPPLQHNQRLNADGVLFWEKLREKFSKDDV